MVKSFAVFRIQEGQRRNKKMVVTKTSISRPRGDETQGSAVSERSEKFIRIMYHVSFIRFVRSHEQ